MPARAISGVAAAVMSRPRKWTAPRLAFHSPMMVLNVVVLPAPLRPRSTVISPSGTSRSTPWRMWYWPMCVCTPASLRSASAIFGRRYAEVGLLHDGRRHHGGRIPIGDDTPFVQDEDAIGEGADHFELVLDQQHRAIALALDVVDEVEDDGHFVHAHAGGRLVEHQHLRLEGEEDRHLEPALLAVRERGRGGKAAIGQPRALEEMPGLLDQLDVARPERQQVETLPRTALHREAHVFHDAPVGKEIRELEGAPY